MTTEAAKAAKARYDAKTARYVSLKLNRNTDQDLIDHLEAQESIQTYIKSLIRADIKRGANTMKTYTVKEEYLSQWGEDVTEDTIITQAELERLSAEWGKPVEELLEQLIEQ